jgi:hypothetical protein
VGRWGKERDGFQVSGVRRQNGGIKEVEKMGRGEGGKKQEWVMGSTEEGVKRGGSASGIQRRSNRDARYTFKDFYQQAAFILIFP